MILSRKKSAIYSKLLTFLEFRHVRHRRTGTVLPFIFHPKAIIPEREKLEREILDFAEFFAQHYEVIRDVPSALFFDLKQSGETDLIFAKRAVPIPNFILNASVCEAIQKEFSRDDILTCEGFILREGYIRLDLDEKHARRGFIAPEIDTKSGLIIGLRVFRFPNDNRPFLLRTRKN